jgi:hypothetical protein
MNENKKKLKIFSTSITEILCYYDPAKLGSFRVPEDEYGSEAEAIIDKLRDVEDMKTLQWAVYDVFEYFFSKEHVLPRWDERYGFIAEEIWEVWQEAIQ